MVELRPYQSEAVEAVRKKYIAGDKATLLVMATGCHDPAQGILMADGRVKQAQDIAIGDKLMGPDGNARTVLALHDGTDEMYCVAPIKGKPFIVNSNHLLSLVRTQKVSNSPWQSRKGGFIETIRVCDWNSQSKTYRHMHKLYRANAIDRFEGNDGSAVTIDPYFLGVLLGDGQTSWGVINVTTPDEEVALEVSRQAEKYGMSISEKAAGKATTYYFQSGRLGCKGGELHNELKKWGLLDKTAGEKAVPFYYKTLPYRQRIEVLAGLLDSDGSLSSNSSYDFISKSKQLSEDVAFLARSCGLAAYVKESVKTIKATGFSGTYWRVSISGDCTIIPMRVEHKKPAPRKQKKNVLRTGFSVKPVGEGEYFGFTVDGDNLYLLDDFTVSHNCGKTTVFGEVTRRTIGNGKPVLVLAHREELIEQAAARLSSLCGVEAEIEKAERSYSYNSPLCIASVQSLQGGRLDALRKGWFGLTVIDEAHHSIAPTYRNIIDHVGGHLLGVTATADRADKRGLAEVYDSIAYEYPIARAVAEGWLSPIKAKCIPLSVDLRNVRVSHGDFQANDLGDALEPYLADIASVMVRECAYRKTVVFLPLVKTAEKMADELNRAGLSAVCVSGYDSSEIRKAKLEAFKRGDYDVICNSMLLTEGWDCPEVDCVIVLRPTKSRPLYSQMIGRGTRLSPGKKELLLLDFLWMTAKHDLCRPATLLGKEPDVAKRMTEITEDSGEPKDLFGIAEQAESDVIQQREDALAAELAKQRRKKQQLVDPLQFATSIQDLDLMEYRPTFAWELKDPTEKQLATIEKMGVSTEGIESSGQASALLDALMRRIDNRLATPKQIRLLERYGFKHVGGWLKDDASRMISRISMNKWTVPRSVDPATYEPKG